MQIKTVFYETVVLITVTLLQYIVVEENIAAKFCGSEI